MSTTESRKGSKHRTVEELIFDKQRIIAEVTEKHNLRMQRLNAELQHLEDIRDGRRKQRVHSVRQLSEAERQALEEFQAMGDSERQEALKDMKAKLRVLKLVARQTAPEPTEEASDEEENVQEFEEE